MSYDVLMIGCTVRQVTQGAMAGYMIYPKNALVYKGKMRSFLKRRVNLLSLRSFLKKRVNLLSLADF
jgi:hypothetical protein